MQFCTRISVRIEFRIRASLAMAKCNSAQQILLSYCPIYFSRHALTNIRFLLRDVYKSFRHCQHREDSRQTKAAEKHHPSYRTDTRNAVLFLHNYSELLRLPRLKAAFGHRWRCPKQPGEVLLFRAIRSCCFYRDVQVLARLLSALMTWLYVAWQRKHVYILRLKWDV